MQAKNLDTKLILTELSKFQGKWSTWGTSDWSKKVFNTKEEIMPNIQLRTYPDAPTKVFLAKMKSLIKQDLCGGCDCGCRGDYEITDKGLELIGQKRIVKYTGY